MRICTTNISSKITDWFYLDYLYESKEFPDNIRIDQDTETDIMSIMHCMFLRAKCDDLEDATASILHGPLTQSKIERWWRELLDRMEKFRWLKMVTDSTNKQDSFVRR